MQFASDVQLGIICLRYRIHRLLTKYYVSVVIEFHQLSDDGYFFTLDHQGKVEPS